MSRQGILVFISLFCIIVTLLLCGGKKSQSKEHDEQVVEWRTDPYELTNDNVLAELKAQELDFPEIVLAQAILETGHYKSNVCTSYNNLFGLRTRKGTYMKFEHWTQSVAAYKRYIQKYKTTPEDYYQYLDSLGYAEDTSYTAKVKQLTQQYKQ